MKNEILLVIESPVLFYTSGIQLTIESPLKLYKGVSALIGPNGSGKTTFAKIIQKGRNFRTNRITAPDGVYPDISYLEFNDIHSISGFSVEYYQQRYEASMNDEVPFVSEILSEKFNSDEFNKWCDIFQLRDIGNKRINYLSSGELRKLLIINTLLDNPEILILDNPYIGLDAPSRNILNEALFKLKMEGKSVFLILSDDKDIPNFVDHLLYFNKQEVSYQQFNDHTLSNKSFPFESHKKTSYSEIICELKDCEIRYGNRVIINNLNWKICKGERWCLSGPNGSGKSTLLSLINADNPKGYSSDLTLFGKRRGTGESIWDIKKRIGYVSPEAQLHFHGSGSVINLVANGLNDTVGFYVQPKETQIQEAEKWLSHFNISHLSERMFHTLSSGERQLILIARAFIKQPQLLILDEPMHALDPQNRKRVMKTIENFLDNFPSSAFIMVSHVPEDLPSSINYHLSLSSL